MAHGVVVWWAKYHLISLKYTNYILKTWNLSSQNESPSSTTIQHLGRHGRVANRRRCRVCVVSKTECCTCSLKPTIGTVFPMIPSIFFWYSFLKVGICPEEPANLDNWLILKMLSCEWSSDVPILRPRSENLDGDTAIQELLGLAIWWTSLATLLNWPTEHD